MKEIIINAAEAMELLKKHHFRGLKEMIADAPELVRCRDCVNDGLTECPVCYIEQQTLCFVNHDPEFYCGMGERKDDELPRNN